MCQQVSTLTLVECLKINTMEISSLSVTKTTTEDPITDLRATSHTHYLSSIHQCLSHHRCPSIFSHLSPSANQVCSTRSPRDLLTCRHRSCKHSNLSAVIIAPSNMTTLLTNSLSLLTHRATTGTIRNRRGSTTARAGSIRGHMLRGEYLGGTTITEGRCRCRWWTSARACKSRFKHRSINKIHTTTRLSLPTWWTIRRPSSIRIRAWLLTPIPIICRSRCLTSSKSSPI